MYTRRIVCLANSFKYGGTCVAGKELSGAWIRPISARPTTELSAAEARYAKGAPKLLDIIDVPLLQPAPKLYQTENHIIDSTRTWLKAGELPADAVSRLSDDPPRLFINSGSTRASRFDCISMEEAAALRSSLLLIRPEKFSIVLDPRPAEHSRPHRASFLYKNVAYNLKLTDPVAITLFDLDCLDAAQLNDIHLCVSLTEPWDKDKRCYKLVAAVFTDPPLR